jgi:hypothetical protein
LAGTAIGVALARDQPDRSGSDCGLGGCEPDIRFTVVAFGLVFGLPLLVALVIQTVLWLVGPRWLASVITGATTLGCMAMLLVVAR